MQAVKIVLRFAQAVLGLILLVAVFGNAGRLIQNFAAVLRTGGHNLVDPSLPDDGIAIPAKAGVHKQQAHILQPHGRAVKPVLTAAGAVAAAGHLHLVCVTFQQPGGIINGQRHLSIPHRAALLGAVEDHILHLGAAQALAGLLTQHPADGVTDIGFTAAIGSHNGRNAVAEPQHGLIGKRLEAMQLQGLK